MARSISFKCRLPVLRSCLAPFEKASAPLRRLLGGVQVRTVLFYKLFDHVGCHRCMQTNDSTGAGVCESYVKAHILSSVECWLYIFLGLKQPHASLRKVPAIAGSFLKTCERICASNKDLFHFLPCSVLFSLLVGDYILVIKLLKYLPGLGKRAKTYCLCPVCHKTLVREVT